jgi:uncharacterized phage-associated protein
MTYKREMNTMALVNEVANFFIKYFYKKGRENDLTNMKLNKLLYFAYGIYLARTDKELFECDFKAYQHGPVEERIYCLYKDHGDCVIRTPRFLNLKDIEFDEEQEEVIIDVLNEYGGKAAWALSDLTHDDIDSPWRKVSCKNKEVIPKEEIRKYFQENGPKTVKEIIKDKKIYDYTDKKGNLVLPCDDEDKEDDWS